eukprot:2621696-Pyramimonas_sp.AAC.1
MAEVGFCRADSRFCVALWPGLIWPRATRPAAHSATHPRPSHDPPTTAQDRLATLSQPTFDPPATRL